jgi:hypothetical protein
METKSPVLRKMRKKKQQPQAMPGNARQCVVQSLVFTQLALVAVAAAAAAAGAGEAGGWWGCSFVTGLEQDMVCTGGPVAALASPCPDSDGSLSVKNHSSNMVR